jgi:ABC-type branched-subunit amino acid transport system permease subunit
LNTQTAFSPILGITPVVAAMTGGSGIFLGPIIGSFILGIVNQFFAVNTFLTLSPIVITGVLLILVGLFIPGGLLRINALREYAYRQPDRKITRLFWKRKNAMKVAAPEKSAK